MNVVDVLFSYYNKASDDVMEHRILQLLQQQYPSVAAASTELINLSAILELPKGTEYFISDIHGEYDAFNHYLKNASGIILEKIKLVFPSYSTTEQNRLARTILIAHEFD